MVSGLPDGGISRVRAPRSLRQAGGVPAIGELRTGARDSIRVAVRLKCPCDCLVEVSLRRRASRGRYRRDRMLPRRILPVCLIVAAVVSVGAQRGGGVALFEGA